MAQKIGMYAFYSGGMSSIPSTAWSPEQVLSTVQGVVPED